LTTTNFSGGWDNGDRKTQRAMAQVEHEVFLPKQDEKERMLPRLSAEVNRAKKMHILYSATFTR